MKEKKLRIEDALTATKAAVEEGIVAGGGVALITAIPLCWIPCWPPPRATRRPASRLCSRLWRSRCARSLLNAGLEGSVIIDKITFRRQGQLWL